MTAFAFRGPPYQLMAHSSGFIGKGEVSGNARPLSTTPPRILAPRPSPPSPLYTPQNSVISTEAAHSLIVSGAAERPPHLHLQLLLVAGTART